jgi:hypothetical protein
MNTNSFRKLFGLAALASVVAGAQGCVADRPSRNAVFDENQYIRKDFLIQNLPNGAPDPGWFMKATIVQTSTPNPLASDKAGGFFTGAENNSQGDFVRFAITSDRLQLIDQRELTSDPTVQAQNATTPSIINAWPITNVDLKYQVNLDGETTNQYSENQELDWQVRQWVKLQFDKNDFSDVAGLGAMQSLMLAKCGDAGNSSSTLVPNTFLVDTANNYMQWTLSVTVPLLLNDQDCVTAFGSAGTDFVRMGRSAVTLNVMYSMVRAAPVDPTYVPMIIAEKDPIQHKYGPILWTNFSRDMSTGLLAANEYVTRYNPTKPITWYFAPGFPAAEQAVFTRPNTGIVAGVNNILKASGATARVNVLNYNDLNTLGDGAGPVRQYGDVRYSFLRWESDLDTDSPFLAVTQFTDDPRNGQIISASINVAGADVQDFVAQRTAAYLEQVLGPTGDPFADPPPDYTKTVPLGTAQPTLSNTCTVGQSIPIVPAVVQANLYANSTLFQKMALYLPPAPDGAATPGPTDYVYPHTGAEGQTFMNAYAQYLPYITYADPLANQFVTPQSTDSLAGSTAGTGTTSLSPLLTTLHNETLFEQAASQLDHGAGLAATSIGDGPSGMQAAYNAVDADRQLRAGRDDYRYMWSYPRSLARGDTADAISFPQVIARSSRQCIAGAGPKDPGGAAHWETLAEYEAALVQSYWEVTLWHEVGHVMGLEHNFMGSVDKNNFPTYTDANGQVQYGKLSSSLMDYSISYDDTDWNNGAGTPGGGSTTTVTAAHTGFLSYDQAAIAWIYGNNVTGPTQKAAASVTSVGISGQASATSPWNDPLGWKGTTEIPFLRCSEQHTRYTPLCKPFDIGSTPSEIVAADIEAYEWNYHWANFRNYYKVWDDSTYGAKISDKISESRRFQSLWDFDWSPGELTNKLLQIGINPPAGAVNSGNFYSQLVNDFAADVNSAMQLNAAWHEAIIQQQSGQRPYATSYDAFYGDVTQQGIALDKEYSFEEWLGLWAYDNYDPTQAAGLYGSSLVNGPGATNPAQAWSAAASMLGEKGSWDAYPVFFPSAVALFAHDTQSVLFEGLGYPQMRDWVGGKVFVRVEDAIEYFQQLAVQNPLGPNGCTTLATCTYNPMTPRTDPSDIGHSSTVQSFVGPDSRRYSWLYFQDRNEYYFVDQDRNPSSYFQVYTYNTDVLTTYDDGNPGNGNVFADDLNVKFMLDAYSLFGGLNSTAQ